MDKISVPVEAMSSSRFGFFGEFQSIFRQI